MSKAIAMDVLTIAYPTIPLSGNSELVRWYLKIKNKKIAIFSSICICSFKKDQAPKQDPDYNL